MGKNSKRLYKTLLKKNLSLIKFFLSLPQKKKKPLLHQNLIFFLILPYKNSLVLIILFSKKTMFLRILFQLPENLYRQILLNSSVRKQKTPPIVWRKIFPELLEFHSTL